MISAPLDQSPRSKLLFHTKSSLILLLLALLFFFNAGPSLLFSVLAFALLAGYHLLTDRPQSREQIVGQGLIRPHIALYLLLCTLVIWATTADEESVFWVVYLLPVAVAASSLELPGTLTTCGLAWLLFVSQVPSKMLFDPRERSEAWPELLVFGLVFFLVGALMQSLAEQNRRQMAVQTALTRQLQSSETELRQSLSRLEAAEEDLRRKDRLAALGAMSAGMAHEIRNPLGVISSSAQLLEGRLAGVDPNGQLLGIIQEETARLNQLISAFLAFGRPATPQLQRCDLREIVARVLLHLGSLAKEHGVLLQADAPPAAMLTQADPAMLQQVLLNLLLNALDATPTGGQVQVGLQRQDGRVLLQVRDDGCGIPADLQQRVFDPFFTTKDQGTGLGLATAYKIIESHGGELRLVSQPGAGATFCIDLPAAEEA